ncbi:MAG: TIGR04283 family arsenosugar biosynthesis glycosyltransferase [Rhodospirillales bacterium]|nr:TIGR04283 family arsenosugar biosynthesis glycosyltransferase [Rhodospirillales bacterium]
MLSIIIPTLNVGQSLKSTLDTIVSAASLAHEVIVADGGSVDDTALIAERGGAIFLETHRGRGQQMAEGALAAAGDWFLFLHADTQLQTGWTQAVQAFIADSANQAHAGYFRFALNDRALAARIVEYAVRLRSRVFCLPYGDQGLLISRSFYEGLGGYKRLPLMEDVDFVRRIGRRRMRPLKATAVTSAEKYRRDGYLLRPLRNLFVLSLYAAGVSPRYLSTRYR